MRVLWFFNKISAFFYHSNILVKYILIPWKIIILCRFVQMSKSLWYVHLWFQIVVTSMCIGFCVVGFCALYMLGMICFVLQWTLCFGFCALWHLSTWFCVGDFTNYNCLIWNFVHENVCFFLCSITRYNIIDDIEAIILTEFYKVWKVD